jgi:hypothetical protein
MSSVKTGGRIAGIYDLGRGGLPPGRRENRLHLAAAAGAKDLQRRSGVVETRIKPVKQQIGIIDGVVGMQMRKE